MRAGKKGRCGPVRERCGPGKRAADRGKGAMRTEDEAGQAEGARRAGGEGGGGGSPRLLAGATRLLVLVLLVLVPRAALRAPAPPPPPLPMRAPRGQRRRHHTCVPHARRGIVEDENEITALRRYRISISYLSTSISNNNVISCRFDIVDGYRVVQLQYRVIQTNSPSHPLSSPRADRKSQQK
jgi:hypothetical protein